MQNALNNAALIKAIGAGIGNNSAHEIAHQFLGLTPGMHDGSQNTYVGGDCDGSEAPCVYGRGAIQWGPNRTALKNALGVIGAVVVSTGLTLPPPAPMTADGVPAELRVFHVEKRAGLPAPPAKSARSFR